jgi:hypothetical protein
MPGGDADRLCPIKNQSGGIEMSTTAEKSGAAAVRLFRVEFPDQAFDDLRRRVATARGAASPSVHSALAASAAHPLAP